MTGFSYCNEILIFPSPPPSPAVSVMVWYTILYNAPYQPGGHTIRLCREAMLAYNNVIGAFSSIDIIDGEKFGRY